jgi:hypothetical protein
MGTAIVNALKTGLSLIQDLAEAFLNGFTTLFWDATANSGAGALTVFGEYALIMLSVAIVFAVISLCFGVLRSNAGV